jgi:poly(A) polymerase
MRQAGVLTAVLPESEKWGIDAIHALVKAENAMGHRRDPIRADTSERAFRQALYGGDKGGISDRLKLALGNARYRAEQDDKALVEAGGYARLLKLAESWEKPAFPLKGADLLGRGWQKGPELGAALKSLEKDWIGRQAGQDRWQASTLPPVFRPKIVPRS